MMQQLGLGIGATKMSATIWETEAVSLFERMAVAPSDARKQLINRTIRALKVNGVWSRLDALYVLAAHDSQAARCNWRQNAYNLTPVGAPSFTVDRGFQGDGMGKHLDTGFVPGAGGQYALNNAHMGVYCLSNIAEDAPDCGNLNSRIFTRTASGRISGRMNDATIPSVLPMSPSSAGHTVFSRSSNASYRVDRNGAEVANPSNQSTSLAESSFTLLGAASLHCAKLLSAFHFGTDLTISQSHVLFSTLVDYMNQVSAL